jgi:ABC-type lipoprotein export system ATPase subunit
MENILNPAKYPAISKSTSRPMVQTKEGSVHIKNLVKQFKNEAGVFTVLKGLNLDIQSGEFISVVGKSGSGKSTLLNMITGIDRPTSGDVLVGGTDLHHLSESQRALWRGRNLGIVFQFFQLLPMLSLLENTLLPMDYTNTYAAGERPEIGMDLLRLVNLEDQADKLPAAVSSGQQQSAAIARALANDPPILVADEPTGNLDSRSAENVIALFERLVNSGKTVLIVTHDPTITTRTHRNIIISDGELVDETVARALPLLNHRQMLDVTHKIKRQVIAVGQEILKSGSPVNNFYMITRGEVEIVIQTQRCPDLTVARLGAGQFFGEVELMRGGNSIATARAVEPDTLENAIKTSQNFSPHPASADEVELLVLLHREFLEMVKSSPLTEDALAKIVQHRLKENEASTRDCR